MLRKNLSFGLGTFNNVMTYRTTGCGDFQEKDFSFLLFLYSDLAWAIDTRRSHGSQLMQTGEHSRHTQTHTHTHTHTILNTFILAMTAKPPCSQQASRRLSSSAAPDGSIFDVPFDLAIELDCAAAHAINCLVLGIAAGIIVNSAPTPAS
jgi:hypothetical protein